MKKLLLFFFICYTVNLCSQEKKDTIAPKKWIINGKLTFLVNQSAFSNWVAGGNNTVAGNIGVNYDFNYKKNNWNWDNKITSSYGLSYVSNQGVRKTDDRFEYNSLLGLKAKKYWYFSFFNNFKTQFTNGYDYKTTPKTKISSFLAPAYLSFGPGMLWKKSDVSRVNIAPATTRFTFVSDKFSGKYGVSEGKNSVLSLGFNLSAYFKFPIMQDVTMENVLAVYSDYLNKPQNIDIDYQTNFFVKINKYLSMNFSVHTIVDDNASSNIQLKQVFGLGLNYLFHKV